MKLSTSLIVGTLVGAGALAGMAALAAAQSPPPLPAAPPATVTAVSAHLKALMEMIRGGDPNISPQLRARALEIFDYVARRTAAKIFPSITKNEIAILYDIAQSKSV